MKKWIGWIGFFLVIIGLIVGGIFLTSHFKGETFRFKEVEILDYNDFTLNDFVEQDIVCNSKGCKFRDKDIIYTISDVKELGEQHVIVKMKYEGEEYEKTFHVDVVDKKAPEIILSDTFIIIDMNEKIDEKSYLKEVKDNYDTLSMDDVKIDNQVDLKKSGEYQIIYTIQDSSKNEGKAVLKVKVKDQKDKETVSTNDNKKDEKPVVEEKTTLNYSISGLFNDSGAISQGVNLSMTEKNIEVGWDTTLKVSAKINTDAKIWYIISKNKITGKELTPIGGKGFPAIGGGEVVANQSSSYEYTFTEEGIYYFSILVTDAKNNIKLRKDYVLTLTDTEEVRDMKMVTTDKGSYILIDCYYLGGKNQELYAEVAIQDTSDPNIEGKLVVENDEFRLYYTKGYYYDLVALLYSGDGRLLKTDTLKIQK